MLLVLKWRKVHIKKTFQEDLAIGLIVLAKWGKVIVTHRFWGLMISLTRAENQKGKLLGGRYWLSLSWWWDIQREMLKMMVEISYWKWRKGPGLEWYSRMSVMSADKWHMAGYSLSVPILSHPFTEWWLWCHLHKTRWFWRGRES